MIRVLQRIGHREIVLGFLGWSLFAISVMHTASSALAAWILTWVVPVVAGSVTIAFGILLGHRMARRGTAVAIACVVANTVPIAIAGAIITSFSAQLGAPLLIAPVLFGIGGAFGIAVGRQNEAYQNPGSAAIGACVMFGVLGVGAWLSLSAMEGLWRQGVTEIYSYLAEYDCLDEPRARLAGAIHSFSSQQNRERIERALQSDDPMHARPCKP